MTSPFTCHSHYPFDKPAVVDTLRITDPVKQLDIVTPHENRNRPPIVPREFLVLAEDVLLPLINPHALTTFFLTSSVVKTPPDDTSCST